MVLLPPAKVALAPLAGVVKVTTRPEIGVLLVSLTRTWSWVPNGLLIGVCWPVPLTGASVGALTTYCTPDESLIVQWLSPLYSALIKCVPTARDVLLNRAWLFGPSGTVARTVPESLKITEPVGVATPGATTLTVAVKVAVRVAVPPAADAVSVVVVEALLTSTCTVALSALP